MVNGHLQFTTTKECNLEIIYEYGAEELTDDKKKMVIDTIVRLEDYLSTIFTCKCKSLVGHIDIDLACSIIKNKHCLRCVYVTTTEIFICMQSPWNMGIAYDAVKVTEEGNINEITFHMVSPPEALEGVI